jgi:hypothetical protein
LLAVLSGKFPFLFKKNIVIFDAATAGKKMQNTGGGEI